MWGHARLLEEPMNTPSGKSPTQRMRLSTASASKPPAAALSYDSTVLQAQRDSIKSVAKRLALSILQHGLAALRAALQWLWCKRGLLLSVPRSVLAWLLSTRAGQTLLSLLSGLAVFQLSWPSPLVSRRLGSASTRVDLSLSLLWGFIRCALATRPVCTHQHVTLRADASPPTSARSSPCYTPTHRLNTQLQLQLGRPGGAPRAPPSLAPDAAAAPAHPPPSPRGPPWSLEMTQVQSRGGAGRAAAHPPVAGHGVR
jgi:hypothetical protein